MNREADDKEDAPVTLIVEPNHEGHRFYYVALLVRECIARGDSVIVMTTAKAAKSPEWGCHLNSLGAGRVLYPPEEFRLPEIARISTRLRTNLTILPEADHYNHYLWTALRYGWTGSGNLALLSMRADGQPGPPFAWLRPAKTVAKRALIWVAGFRPRVRSFALHSPLAPRRGPLRWVADPVTLECSSEQVEAMRRSLNEAGDRYWVGVFGSVTPRKNLPLIVEAILNQPDLGLLIAGSMDEGVSIEIAPLLSTFVSNGGRVINLPGPLADAEFDSAIKAEDCVIIAHSNEGTSGTVLKAAAAGRRLVLAGARSLKQDAVRLGDQAIWSPLDVDSLRRAILQTRRLPEPTKGIELGEEQFCKALTWSS